MRKIIFGAVIGATAMYFLDPRQGADRRKLLTGLWAERKDTVLEAARTTAGAVSGVSQGVSGVVSDRLTDVQPSDESSTNGSPVESGSSEKKGSQA